MKKFILWLILKGIKMKKEKGIYRYNNLFITKASADEDYFFITHEKDEDHGYFDEIGLTLENMRRLYILIGKCLKDQNN